MSCSSRIFSQQEVAAKILSLVAREEAKLLNVRPLGSEFELGHAVRDNEASEKDSGRSESERPVRQVGIPVDTLDRGGSRSKHQRRSRSNSRWAFSSPPMTGYWGFPITCDKSYF